MLNRTGGVKIWNNLTTKY